MNLRIIFLLMLFTISVLAKRDRIKLKDVETLTLYSDKFTTSRRSAPIKQLACVGGYCRVVVQAAQCYNRGFDGNDIQWECKSELPSNYKFGRLEVSCEGYEYPDDDYILVGSCGLEYTIEDATKNSNSHHQNYQSEVKDYGGGSTMMSIIVVIFIAAAVYFTLRPNNPPKSEATSGGTQPSAPPPPGFRSDYCGSGDYSSNTGGTSSGTSSGPGFFSGMAAGGFLGYLFGSNRNNSGYRRRGYYDTSSWSMPSSSRYSSFGSSSYSGGSSTTSTSTGFGSTKRR